MNAAHHERLCIVETAQGVGRQDTVAKPFLDEIENRVLQLLEDSQQHQDHASDGGRRYNLPLEHGRYCDDDGD